MALFNDEDKEKLGASIDAAVLARIGNAAVNRRAAWIAGMAADYSVLSEGAQALRAIKVQVTKAPKVLKAFKAIRAQTCWALLKASIRTLWMSTIRRSIVTML
jgi:hypothetical protein